LRSYIIVLKSIPPFFQFYFLNTFLIDSESIK